MKAGFLICLTFAVAANAQPHGRHHKHHKRDVVYKTNVVTEVQVVTAVAPTAVVIVDGNGNPITTKYGSGAVAAPSSENKVASSFSAPGVSTEIQIAKPEPTIAKATHAHSVPSSPPRPSASAKSPTGMAQAPASSGSSAGDDLSGRGIAYSPYNGDGSCKSQAQINADFQNINGYGMIRLYGTDCNQTATVLNAASAKNMKIFAGVYDVTQVNSEIQLIIDAAQHDWSTIDTVSIGNEGVNDGKYTVAQAVSAVSTARSLLKAAGYTGNVVTVDTFVAIIANPELCQVSDYAAANCHAFFDGHQTAAQAGDFTRTQAQRVSQACGGKRTVITEAGWPWSGSTNGVAVPGVANQATAIASLKSYFHRNIILFTAFDDMWKKNNALTFNAEQYWGILDHAT